MMSSHVMMDNVSKWEIDVIRFWTVETNLMNKIAKSLLLRMDITILSLLLDWLRVFSVEKKGQSMVNSKLFQSHSRDIPEAFQSVPFRLLKISFGTLVIYGPILSKWLFSYNLMI